MKKILLLSPFIFLLLFIFLYCFDYFFRIRKILVISPDREIFGLTELADSNYLFLDEKKTVSMLLQKNSNYRNIKFVKNFPGKIVLNFEARPAFAEIISGSRNFYVDKEGYPAKFHKLNVNLYKISIPNLIYNNSSADWRLTKTINLINNLNNYGFQLSDIAINNDSTEISVILDNSTKIIAALDKDPNEVAASLQTIISRFRIEGKNITSIDYRFDKPIVVLKNE